jgi:hypothetical protein
LLLVINELQAHAVGIVSAAGKTIILLQADITSVVTLAMRVFRHSQNSILRPVLTGDETGQEAAIDSPNSFSNIPIETNPGANRDFSHFKKPAAIRAADVSNLKQHPQSRPF